MDKIQSVEFVTTNEDGLRELTLEFNHSWWRKLFGIPPKTQTWVSKDLYTWSRKKDAKPASLEDELIIIQALLTFEYTARNYHDRIRVDNLEV